MATTLLEALATIMSLKRWNLMPQVETWMESENIAYYTHIAFAIAKDELNLTNSEIEILLTRCLLKSFSKHTLSDVSVSSRNIIRQIDSDLWKHLINETARHSAALFPRLISGTLEKYLTYEGHYESLNSGVSLETKDLIEELISYCQYKVAMEECSYNMVVFNTPRYKKIYADLQDEINKINPDYLIRFEKSFNSLKDYFDTIRHLKYLRRWNTINRSIESTVMGHTFVVAVFALLFSHLSREQKAAELDNEFIYSALLRALFHDVPESLTGDIITPVKEIIDKKRPNTIELVEEKLVAEFIATVPEPVRKELVRLNLLVDFNDRDLFSVDSLVRTCDQMALVLECLFERRQGSRIVHMEKAYEANIVKLQNSEWPCVREYANELLLDYPKL
ncbi:MAG: HD domain-containing protein [Ignavibacteria bacterium]|nr:HD domain-containing protein [Ignavibacteria bacterium]